MFDAFTILVRMNFASNGAAMLGGLLRDLGRVEGAVGALQSRFRELAPIAVSALSVFVGVEALKGLWNITKQAEALNNELQKTKSLGGDFAATIDAARAQAFRTSASVPTMTPDAAVRMQRELGTQLQNPSAAAAVVDSASKLATVVSFNTKEPIEEVTKNLVKLAELRGKIFSPDAQGVERVDPTKLNKEMDAAARSLILFSAYMKSDAMVTMARQAGLPIKTMSEEAFYGPMIEAAVSMGAAKTGTALTSLEQQFLGGPASKRAIEEMVKLKMIKPGEAHQAKGQSQIVLDPAAVARFRSQGLAEDTPKWVVEHMVPAIEAAGMRGPAALDELFRLISRQNVMRLVAEMMTNNPQMDRARKLFGDVPNASEQYGRLIKEDLSLNVTAFTAAWTGLMQALGSEGIPLAIKTLQTLTDGLHVVTEAVVAHPDAAKLLIELAGGLSALMVASGGVGVITLALTPLSYALSSMTTVLAGANTTAAIANAGRLFGAGGTIILLGLALAGLAHEVDAAVPALRRLDDAVAGFLRSTLSRIGDIARGAAKGFVPGGPEMVPGTAPSRIPGIRSIPNANPWTVPGGATPGAFHLSPMVPPPTLRHAAYQTDTPRDQSVPLYNVIYLNTDRVAEGVTRSQARMANRPPAGTTQVDVRSTPIWPSSMIPT